MAGNGAAEIGTAQPWLEQVFGQLQALVDEAVQVLVEADPPKDVAEAEKRARAVGVVARTAKAVAALKTSAKKVSGDAEDDLAGSGEVIDEAEEQRLRAELFARVDHLFEVAERKGYGPKGDRGGGASATGKVLAATPGVRPEQVCNPPDEGWRTWVLLGGRGSGKTFAGGFWINELARKSDVSLALVGPAFHDVREVMIEGPSGLRALAAPDNRPRWEASRRRLVWPSGAAAYGFSAEDPDSLRGPQFHAAWADEFCAWREPDKVLSNLRFGLRLGDDPKLAITTTPRPIAALRRLLAEAGVVTSRLSTRDNEANLAPGFLGHLRALYAGTRLEAQEMEGLIVEADGALFRAEDLARARGSVPVRLERVVVAVDPPVTATGDACGIVVCGRREGRAYVLADCSVRGMSPVGWAQAAVKAASEHGADLVLAEANQGGEMVRTLLAQVGCEVAIKLVHATRSKKARAEPVAALYEQGRVVHCGAFPALEEELMAMGSEHQGHSPDRADALVWSVTHLLLAGRVQPRLRSL